MSLTEQLRAKGFDVEEWQMPSATENMDMLQITDSTGITFYLPEYSTLEQCLARYAEKQEQFRKAVNQG